MSFKLAQILTSQGLFTDDEMSSLFELHFEQEKKGFSFDTTLLFEKKIPLQTMLQALQEVTQFNGASTYFRLSEIETSFVQEIGEETSSNLRIFPYNKKEGIFHFLSTLPLKPSAIKNIEEHFQQPIQILLVPQIIFWELQHSFFGVDYPCPLELISDYLDEFYDFSQNKDWSDETTLFETKTQTEPKENLFEEDPQIMDPFSEIENDEDDFELNLALQKALDDVPRLSALVHEKVQTENLFEREEEQDSSESFGWDEAIENAKIEVPSLSRELQRIEEDDCMENRYFNNNHEVVSWLKELVTRDGILDFLFAYAQTISPCVGLFICSREEIKGYQISNQDKTIQQEFQQLKWSFSPKSIFDVLDHSMVPYHGKKTKGEQEKSFYEMFSISPDYIYWLPIRLKQKIVGFLFMGFESFSKEAEAYLPHLIELTKETGLAFEKAVLSKKQGIAEEKKELQTLLSLLQKEEPILFQEQFQKLFPPLHEKTERETNEISSIGSVAFHAEQNMQPLRLSELTEDNDSSETIVTKEFQKNESIDGTLEYATFSVQEKKSFRDFVEEKQIQEPPLPIASDEEWPEEIAIKTKSLPIQIDKKVNFEQELMISRELIQAVMSSDGIQQVDLGSAFENPAINFDMILDDNMPNIPKVPEIDLDVMKLLSLLESKHQRIRETALEALGDISIVRTIPTVFHLFMKELELSHLNAKGEIRDPGEENWKLFSLWNYLQTFPDETFFCLLGNLYDFSLTTRFAALLLLQQLPIERSLPHLFRVLREPRHEKIRILTSRILRSIEKEQTYQDIVEWLLNRLKSSPKEDEYKKLILLLHALRCVRLIPFLIERISEKSNAEILLEISLLEDLTKQMFGANTSKWQKWWEKIGCQTERVDWLIEGLSHKEEQIMKSSIAELFELTGQDFDFAPELPKKERQIAVDKWMEWRISNP